MTYPIAQPADNAAAYTWTPPIRAAIAGVNDHQTRVNALEGSSSVLIANSQTGTTYTLVLSDANKVIELTNAAAITLTIPTNASVAFPVGTLIELYQGGAGQVTVSTSVTLRAPDGAKLAKQYASASLRKRATDEWVLSGNVTT